MSAKKKPPAAGQEPKKRNEDLQQQLDEMQIRLAEAEETLRAIREGEVDAVVVSGTKGDQIFSLVGTDSIYRLIVETMKEAAFTLAFDGTVLFCNAQFGQFVKRPLELIVGHPLQEFVADNNHSAASSLLSIAQQPVRQRLVFKAVDGTSVPAHVSANVLKQPDGMSICVVASDLTELENSTELIQQLRRQQEALQAANEELAATEEELRVQNEEVVASRAELDRIRARYQDLFETAPDGYIVTAPEGTIQDANQAAAQLLGRPAQELRGNPFSALLPSGDREHYRQLLASLNAGTSLPKWEVEIRPIEGPRFWADVTAAASRDEEGNITGLRWLIRDVTARRQAEEALRESEQRFRIMGEILPYGVWWCNAQGGAEYTSQSFLDLIEMTMDQMREFGWTGRLAPDEVEPMMKRWLQCVNTGEDWNDEHHVLGPDGKYHAVLTRGRPVHGQDGKIVGWAGINLDIDARKRAEEALRESEQRFRSLFEQSPDAVFLTMPDTGQVHNANPAACTMFGMTVQELCGAGRGIIDPEDSRLAPVLEERKRTGRARGELTCVRKNGQRFPSEVTSVIVPGDPPRSFVIVRDITAAKQAEEAMKQFAEDLARSNQDLSQFAFVASHDLQEPLRMVGGFLNLLQSKYQGQLDDKAQEYIAYSVDGANRMSALIKDLLEYSRVSSKGMEPAPVDLTAIANYVTGNLRAAIEESGAIITADPLPTITADAGQMRQLFQNLIGNALKFRVEGRRPEVEISAKQEDGRWLLRVKDNGIGIPPKQQDRLFVIFQRLHAREKYAGTGIGLAICKKIVERHGGRIWVESAPGQGATFCFTLPAAK